MFFLHFPVADSGCSTMQHTANKMHLCVEVSVMPRFSCSCRLLASRNLATSIQELRRDSKYVKTVCHAVRTSSLMCSQSTPKIVARGPSRLLHGLRAPFGSLSHVNPTTRVKSSSNSREIKRVRYNTVHSIWFFTFPFAYKEHNTLGILVDNPPEQEALLQWRMRQTPHKTWTLNLYLLRISLCLIVKRITMLVYACLCLICGGF